MVFSGGEQHHRSNNFRKMSTGSVDEQMTAFEMRVHSITLSVPGKPPLELNPLSPPSASGIYDNS
ncbi:hypothetical protein BIW11_02468 [Tropilaelaps mercedesae]|uniref:Uncharacterized protein n=1 Tax=Tropilaelaps mercedesae TaxID=418985 RepID=A0A1V9Y2Q1_9ACAR|nr:hypothetical protein BIW11_02468 [Tropilaelaps mercedesae]